MIHQLRRYEIFEHNKSAFHRRFEAHAWRIMRNHGFEILAFWEAHGESGPVFLYLLEWADETAMATAWEAFMADDEWISIKEATGAEHGKMVGQITEEIMTPTSYSPGRAG